MHVRDGMPTDLEELAHVWHDAWHEAHAHVVPPALTSVRTLQNFRDRLAVCLSTVRVVGPPGLPVGFYVLNDTLLDHIYVASKARGSGAAAALIADAERRLAECGVETAWLTCAVGNDRAARFYAKSGWHLVGTMTEQSDTPLGLIPVEVWRYEKRVGTS